MCNIKETTDLDFPGNSEINFTKITSQFNSENAGKCSDSIKIRKLPSWCASYKTKNNESNQISKNIRSDQLGLDNNANNCDTVTSSRVKRIKQEFYDYEDTANNIPSLSDSRNIEQKEESKKLLNSVNAVFIKQESVEEQNNCAEMKYKNVIDDTVIDTDINDIVNHSQFLVKCDDLQNFMNNKLASGSITPNLNSSDTEAIPDLSANWASSHSACYDDISSVGSSSTRMNCQYGNSCYRTSEQHKQQFSHPGDNDFDGGTENGSTSDYCKHVKKPVCWYGTRCYRKNEEHKQRFSHPSTSPNHKCKRKSNVNEINFQNLDDSDEYDTSFIDDDSVDEFQLTESDNEEGFSDFNDYDSSESENEEEQDNRKKKQKKFSLF